jgi:hypothetical protein
MRLGRHHLLRATLGAILLALLLPAAQADSPPKLTRHEMALTSPFCRHAQLFGQDQAAYREMLRRYGGGYRHIHHYCWAEIDAMRLYKHDTPPGYANVGRAISNLDYVLDKTTPSFEFWKDAMILKIKLTDQYRGAANAIPLAQQIVQALPEFADGYVLLARLLIKTQRREEAMAVLELGSQRVTDKKRFDQLKGAFEIR